MYIMLKIFIGYDSNEIVAFHTMVSSIIRYSTTPVSIVPLNLEHMKAFYNRAKDSTCSTEFSYSRFLVPFLSGFEGWSLFTDCDMIVTQDITRLFALADDKYAVQVVKHDYVPKNEIKFLGATQFQYPKKNWSSVMLFNNAKCQALQPSVVQNATGKYLHRFEWLENEDLIGTLPPEWNFLVSEYDVPSVTPSLIHYTVGGPYFNEYQDVDYAENWRQEMEFMSSVTQRK
jgi:lipopolysaccharide biosynthesis glycosyltransferase